MSAPLPPELQSKPRAVPRGIPGRGMANLFLVMFLLIGAGFGVAAYAVSSDMDAGTGPAAGTATVVRIDTVTGSKGSKKAKILFHHEDTDSTCTVPLRNAAGLAPGTEQPYWIIDGAPQIETCARATRRSATGMVIGFSIAGPIEALVGLILSTVFRRRARLYSDGDGAVGVVTAAKKFGRGFSISYEVTTPVEARGRAYLDSRRLTAGQRERPPEPGTPVYVVYDPDKPSRSAIWGLP